MLPEKEIEKAYKRLLHRIEEHYRIAEDAGTDSWAKMASHESCAHHETVKLNWYEKILELPKTPRRSICREALKEKEGKS